MASIRKLAGPVAMSATLTTNIFNDTNTNMRSTIRQIHIANKTSGAVTASLWVGGTGANAAGTEIMLAKSIPANDVYDMYCAIDMLSTDFLVGGAGAGTSLTILVMGEKVPV